jgi:hypothetical protein
VIDSHLGALFDTTLVNVNFMFYFRGEFREIPGGLEPCREEYNVNPFITEGGSNQRYDDKFGEKI